MSIYVIILSVVFLFLLALFFHYQKIKKQNLLKHSGLTNVAEIKLLVSAIQIHRGLSSALLNGDDSKSKSLLSTKQVISTKIQYLGQQDSILVRSRWRSFIDHWGRLNKSNTQGDPENNFVQHTQVIANLLYLLEDEAEFSHLNAIAIPELPHIGFTWRELVGTAEKIGQSRAIGTGVATRKYCSSVHKIRLSFLKQYIEKTMNEVLSELSYVDNFLSEHNELLKNAKLKMEHLILTLEHDLIEPNEITINPNEYFELATAAMTALDNVFEHQLKQIKSVI